MYAHGVTEDEVKDILALPGEDFRGRNDSRIALGQTGAGRYLQVVYVRDPEPNSFFVITAYDLKGPALKAYRRRRRRRGR